MFIKIRLSKIHNQKWLRDRIILVLVCVLATLQYLHGEHYAQCNCIFPDEILDFPCSISLLCANEENNICFENIDIMHFNISIKIHISSIYNNGMAKNRFLLEWLPIQCFKKRLFQLQHFNS
jgi:hypothetical protein